MTSSLLTRDRLRDPQRQIVQMIHEHPALLVVLPMGGGKTVATLTAALDWLNQFEVRRVLVIGPLRVAKDVWPPEIAAWAHLRFLSVAVAVGEPEARAAAVDSGAEITMVNFENLVWLVDYCAARGGWPFDMVVVDESSAFKAGKKRTTKSKTRSLRKVWVVVRKPSPPAPPIEEWEEVVGAPIFTDWREATAWIEESRSEAYDLRQEQRMVTRITKGGKMTRFGALASVRRHIRRIVLLTGTPRPNGVIDLWGQLYLIDQGERLGRTQEAFLRRWFVQDSYTYQVTPRAGAEAEITDLVRDRVFSLPPPAEMPEPTFIEVPVTLPASALAEYRRFKRTLVSEAYDVEAVSRGVLTNKLLQFCNGSMYREDGSLVRIHNAKLEALDDIYIRAMGDPLLVFYSFKFDLAEIRSRYPEAVVLNESETAVDDWNAGRIKMLLAHPRSCAHGLNLQFGGHLAVWYGLTWSLELKQQADARLPRPGQKWPVAIYHLVAQGTDESRLLEVLSNRATTQEAFSEAVRRMILNDD